MKSLKSKHLHGLNTWILSTETVKVDFPDRTEQIIDSVMEKYAGYIEEATHPSAICGLVTNQKYRSAVSP